MQGAGGFAHVRARVKRSTDQRASTATARTQKPRYLGAEAAGGVRGGQGSPPRLVCTFAVSCVVNWAGALNLPSWQHTARRSLLLLFRRVVGACWGKSGAKSGRQHRRGRRQTRREKGGERKRPPPPAAAPARADDRKKPRRPDHAPTTRRSFVSGIYGPAEWPAGVGAGVVRTSPDARGAWGRGSPRGNHSVSRVYPRVRERKCWECVCLLGCWSFRIGNSTAVLLYRLLRSEYCGIVVDVEELFNFSHNNLHM